MITTDQAIALAMGVGAPMFKEGHSMTPTFTVGLSHEKLTALCNKVRRETLLEAAEVATCGGFGSRIIEEVIAEELRRMAGVE